jgi:hypothetical protein
VSDPVATTDDLPGDDPGMEALGEALLTYRDAGLRLPPVPHPLVPRLRELADGIYASEPIDLADREGFLRDATQAATPERVGFGHLGHGVQSWWFCYQIITPALALFLRLDYGGVDSSDPGTLEIINRALLLAEELVVAADAAAARGALGGGRALVVADSLGEAFIALGARAKPQESDDPLAEALARLGAA